MSSHEITPNIKTLYRNSDKFLKNDTECMAKKHLSCGVTTIIIIIGLLLLAAAISLILLGTRSTENGRGVVPKEHPLLVGTNVWPGYEPLYLARSLGYLNDSTVRLVEYSSASQVIRAFRNDAIQIAALTLDEVLLLKEQGHGLRIILVTDISHGADVILGKTNIVTIGDLRGRSIGVESGALGAYVLTRALQQSGVPFPQVEVVPLEVDEHERAFLDGRIDAVVTFEPVRSRLLEKGAVQLFDSSQIPGEIVDVLVVRNEVLGQFPDRVDTLLKGWFDALRYLSEHPYEASKRMADRLKLEPQKVLASYDGLRLPNLDENFSIMEGTPCQLVQTAQRLVEVMKESKLLRRDPQLDDLVSTKPLADLKLR